MIKAYKGEKPYIFVSYSHKDWQRVSTIIKNLQDNLCHIWFDEGIESGRAWNKEIAEYLLKAEVMVLFLSPSSVESEYVKKEINFACNHSKKILPIYLDDIILPIDLEFQLSTIQATYVNKLEEKETLKTIIKILPESVFLHTETPFYIDENYSYYLKIKETLVKAMLDDKDVNGFQISRLKNDGMNEEEILFEYFPTAAYGDGAKYTVTLCEKISDKYFNEQENGIIILNLKATFFLSYPLTGPDFSALLTFVIVNPNGDKASVKLVDCKFATTNHDYDINISAEAIKKELWGSGTEMSTLENKKC